MDALQENVMVALIGVVVLNRKNCLIKELIHSRNSDVLLDGIHLF